MPRIGSRGRPFFFWNESRQRKQAVRQHLGLWFGGSRLHASEFTDRFVMHGHFQVGKDGFARHRIRLAGKQCKSVAHSLG